MNIYQYRNNFKKIANVDCELLYGSTDGMCEPMLSIIITLYKRREYFMEAVHSAVQQKDIDFEYEIIIICDDPEGSCDISDLEDIKNVYFYRNSKNIGLYNSCNMGAKISRGRYISFLHDDDLLYPNYLSEVYEFIISNDPHTECILVNRDIIGNNSKKNIIKEIAKNVIKVLFFHLYFIRLFLRKSYKMITLKEGLKYQLSNIYKAPSCGAFFEKRIFIESGGFNQEFWPVSDYFFFLRFNRDHKIYMLRKRLACYRWFDNLSQNKEIQFSSLDMLTNFFKSRQPVESVERYFNFFRNELVYVKYLMISESFCDEIKHRYPEIAKVNKIRWIIFKIYNISLRFFHDII
ncbi:MAG: glycosyltransferase family 2 protein [Treponema sp.]|jgi:glycosyltransferase involved in cell wall biosynthesis|nr:glycosyltransferase family 2 protein [Treponema sp.]